MTEPVKDIMTEPVKEGELGGWVETEPGSGLYTPPPGYARRPPNYSPEFVKFLESSEAERGLDTYFLYELGQVKGFIQNRIEAVRRRIL